MRHQHAATNMRSAGRGTTLLELLVAMSIFSIISFLFMTTYLDMGRQVDSLESMNRLASTGQTAINVIKDELLQAKEVFSNDARGNSYLAVVDFGARAPLSDSRLPDIRPLGSISPSDLVFDPNAVGNMVFFVKTMAPIWLHLPTTDTWRVVNAYKFVCCYLSIDLSPQATGLPGTPGRLDLWWWESQRYADHLEMSDLLAGLAEDEDIISVVEQLYAVQLERTWDSNADVAVAFHTVSLLEEPYVFEGPLLQIELYDCRSLLTQLHGMDPSVSSSVAFNNLATTMESDMVPRFTNVNNDFPGGFEVIGAGVQASRRIYLRLVTAVWYEQTQTLMSRESITLVSPGIR
ncbi:MAG: type II secretion system protein [Planctomycetota bacterium]|nr:type II secretion system protein [Planctomycetota bacterium]